MSKWAILKLNVLDYDITILQNTTQQGCKQRIQIQQLKRQTQFLGRVMLPEAGLILKIGQWGSNGPPFVILGGLFNLVPRVTHFLREKRWGRGWGFFFKKGGSPKGIRTYWCRLFHGKTNLYWRVAAILEHSGQLKKPGFELLQNPGCLSGEIMTQTKKRKANEKLKGYKSSK